MLTVEDNGFFSLEDTPDDLDVLSCSGEWLRIRLAVPAFDHLRTGDAEAEHHSPTAQVIEGQRGHRRRDRGARGHLADGGAQPNPVRRRALPGEWREAVGSIGLGGPDRIETEFFGRRDLVGDADRWVGEPVAEVESEL